MPVQPLPQWAPVHEWVRSRPLELGSISRDEVQAWVERSDLRHPPLLLAQSVPDILKIANTVLWRLQKKMNVTKPAQVRGGRAPSSMQLVVREAKEEKEEEVDGFTEKQIWNFQAERVGGEDGGGEGKLTKWSLASGSSSSLQMFERDTRLHRMLERKKEELESMVGAGVSCAGWQILVHRRKRTEKKVPNVDVYYRDPDGVRMRNLLDWSGRQPTAPEENREKRKLVAFKVESESKEAAPPRKRSALPTRLRALERYNALVLLQNRLHLLLQRPLPHAGAHTLHRCSKPPPTQPTPPPESLDIDLTAAASSRHHSEAHSWQGPTWGVALGENVADGLVAMQRGDGWVGSGPATVLSRSRWDSWGPTWSAFTSSSAATPTVTADQGVQKVLDVRFREGGGAQVVVGCNAGPSELLCYDLVSGARGELAGHGCQIQAVEYCCGGSAIVSCGGRVVKVWDADTLECRFTLGPGPAGEQEGGEGHKAKISALVVNRWQPWLACSSGGLGDLQLLLWNVASGACLAHLHPPLPLDTLLFASSDLLVGGSDSLDGAPSVVQLWDVEAGRERATMPAHRKFVTALHAEPGGDTILSGSGDGAVGLFDTREGRKVSSLAVGGGSEVTCVSFSGCARFFQASTTANYSLVWDRRMAHTALHRCSHGPPMPAIEFAGQLPGYVDHGDQGVNDAKWLHHSPLLLTGSGNGSVALWDVGLNDPCVKHVKSHQRSVNTVAVAEDDRRICTGGDDQKVVLYDRKDSTRSSEWRLTHPL